MIIINKKVHENTACAAMVPHMPRSLNQWKCSMLLAHIQQVLNRSPLLLDLWVGTHRNENYVNTIHWRVTRICHFVFGYQRFGDVFRKPHLQWILYLCQRVVRLIRCSSPSRHWNIAHIGWFNYNHSDAAPWEQRYKIFHDEVCKIRLHIFGNRIRN